MPTKDLKKGGGLLLPGAPRAALNDYAVRRSLAAMKRLSLASVFMARYDGTIPSEGNVFTAHVEASSAP